MTGDLAYGQLQPITACGERSRLTAEDTVTELFESSRVDVYRYLLTLGLAPAQAQEAAQEVFLRLYVVMRKGQQIENPRAWIFRVAHNHGLNVRGQERSWQPIDPGMDANLPDGGASPEQRMLENERHARLDDALAALSPQQRQCLHLRTEGFRYREIASILGISDSSVGEFLRRAIVRLRKALHA